MDIGVVSYLRESVAKQDSIDDPFGESRSSNVPGFAKGVFALSMDWEQLATYDCPNCHGRLRISANKKLYVCCKPLCHYVIRVTRRDEIASNYPQSNSLLSIKKQIANHEI